MRTCASTRTCGEEFGRKIKTQTGRKTRQLCGFFSVFSFLFFSRGFRAPSVDYFFAVSVGLVCGEATWASSRALAVTSAASALVVRGKLAAGVGVAPVELVFEVVAS